MFARRHAMMLAMPDDFESVLAANARYYDAFENADFEAMSDCWERSERSCVIHPGWPPQYGWGRVAATWDAIFSHSDGMHCIVTDEHVTVLGWVAIVTCEEQLLQGLDSDAPEISAARIAATNVFVRDDEWRMIMHHGSQIHDNGDENEEGDR
jgi:ketosteroid isomerase-like protein